MDLIKNIDIKKIEIYLNYDDKKITNKWIFYCVLSNIVLLYVGVYFYSMLYVHIVSISILSLMLVALWLYFAIKVERNKENLYLYFGYVSNVLPITLSYLSCALFSNTFINWKIPAIVYLVVLPIVSILTLKREYKAIITEKYSQKKYEGPKVGIIYGVTTIGIVGLRFLRGYELFIMALLIGILGMLLAANSYFFIKSYCYKMVRIRAQGKSTEAKKTEEKTGDGSVS